MMREPLYDLDIEDREINYLYSDDIMDEDIWDEYYSWEEEDDNDDA